MKLKTLPLAVLSFVFTVAGLTGVAVSPRQSVQKIQDGNQNYSRWESSDNGVRRRIEIRGKAEFTDDYTDITTVSDGGYVRIEEERDGKSMRYEVRKSAGGPVTRTFWIDNNVRPLDQAARTWLAKLVLTAVRQGGFDADKRVQSILQKKGVSGVLEEIDQINGDYGKRLYFESLIKHANLKTAELQDLLGRAGRQISSDYEQAQLLLGIAPLLADKPEATSAFFEALAIIKSDYEQSRVLLTLLKQGQPTRELLLHVARSTTSITSDYEKANVLKRVATSYVDDPALRTVFFETINSIKSDYERRGVLTSLLKSKTLSFEVMSSLLESAATITSDYEKAAVLVEASNSYGADAKLRSAFLRVVETIKSEYERGKVLSTLLKNKQIG